MAQANFGVYRIDGDGLDLHEEIAIGRTGIGQFHINEGERFRNGKRVMIPNSFHGESFYVSRLTTLPIFLTRSRNESVGEHTYSSERALDHAAIDAERSSGRG
jgi:hypothetical protein